MHEPVENSRLGGPPRQRKHLLLGLMRRQQQTDLVFMTRLHRLFVIVVGQGAGREKELDCFGDRRYIGVCQPERQCDLLGGHYRIRPGKPGNRFGGNRRLL